MPVQSMPLWMPFLLSAVLFGPIGAAGNKEHKEPPSSTVAAKPASAFTVALRAQAAAGLPWDDVRDVEEASRGLKSKYPHPQIVAANGKVVWDMGSYNFLLQGKTYPSIHPALQRQAELNMAYGLYEVIPGQLYQLRGFDLANLSLLKGKTGWIVFDTLTCKETSSAALKFANDELVRLKVIPKPLLVMAVIISHPHTDHFGGIRGLVNETDMLVRNVQVIAPEGFLEEAISENLYAGNAMSRRSHFQYGLRLPRNEFAHVDQAIGKNTAHGTGGLIKPNVLIPKDRTYVDLQVDGITITFHNTPDTEAPVEINAYIKDLKAFWAAENLVATIHNIYTLRGAQVRDPLSWYRHINEALYKFPDAEVLFTAHSWPRWGTARIQELMRVQRDVYANLNNQVLHLVNKGVSISEVHNVYALPPVLKRKWLAQSYHGSEQHNSRAVVNKYIGYWDANPATLIPLSPKDSAPLYVEMMGGAKRIISKARQLHKDGLYLHAVEILNRLVFAQPGNVEARRVMADALEQVGYQKESTSLRNVFLEGAAELRCGAPKNISSTLSPDFLAAMTTGQWLDFVGISLDPVKANTLTPFVMNLINPDVTEQYVVEFSGATLSNIEGFRHPSPNVTVTVPRAALNPVLAGQKTLEDLRAAGVAIVVGSLVPWNQMYATIVVFHPDFPVFPEDASIKCPTTPAK